VNLYGSTLEESENNTTRVFLRDCFRYPRLRRVHTLPKTSIFCHLQQCYCVVCTDHFSRFAFAYTLTVIMISRALRGMIVEFLFFICIAAICFSGLLFTLWDLASGTWTVREIAWLMIQIWFGWSRSLLCFAFHWTVLCPFAGNTWLSFGQASSFHAVLVSPLDNWIC
jgi:hypothetical protein